MYELIYDSKFFCVMFFFALLVCFPFIHRYSCESYKQSLCIPIRIIWIAYMRDLKYSYDQVDHDLFAGKIFNYLKVLASKIKRKRRNIPTVEIADVCMRSWFYKKCRILRIRTLTHRCISWSRFLFLASFSETWWNFAIELKMQSKTARNGSAFSRVYVTFFS